MPITKLTSSTENRNEFGKVSQSLIANSVSSPPYEVKVSSNSPILFNAERLIDALLNKKYGNLIFTMKTKVMRQVYNRFTIKNESLQVK